MSISMVYIPCPTIEVARDLGRQLLEDHLVACINLIPSIESHYWWEGKLESSAEVLLIGKTTFLKHSSIEKRVLELHPYDLPAIVFYSGEATSAFGAWVANETDRGTLV